MNLIGSPMKQISFYFKGKNIKLQARECSFLRKGFGLIFRKSNTDNLIFTFKEDSTIALTSLFVFFPFLAVWLDSKDKVIDYKLINPFCPTIKIDKKFRKIIEIPLNIDNLKIISFFVGKGKV